MIYFFGSPRSVIKFHVFFVKKNEYEKYIITHEFFIPITFYILTHKGLKIYARYRSIYMYNEKGINNNILFSYYTFNDKS